MSLPLGEQVNDILRKGNGMLKTQRCRKNGTFNITHRTRTRDQGERKNLKLRKVGKSQITRDLLY